MTDRLGVTEISCFIQSKCCYLTVLQTFSNYSGNGRWRGGGGGEAGGSGGVVYKNKHQFRIIRPLFMSEANLVGEASAGTEM